jgi:hypothetical protein
MNGEEPSRQFVIVLTGRHQPPNAVGTLIPNDETYSSLICKPCLDGAEIIRSSEEDVTKLDDRELRAVDNVWRNYASKVQKGVCIIVSGLVDRVTAKCKDANSQLVAAEFIRRLNDKGALWEME